MPTLEGLCAAGVVFEHAWATPGVTILNRVEFEELTQDDAGVVVRGRRLDSGGACSPDPRTSA